MSTTAQQVRGYIEGFLEGFIPQQKMAMAVEQHKGVRHALDTVDQARFCGLGAGLGQTRLGNVERDAEQLRVLARRDAIRPRATANIQPADLTILQRDGEGGFKQAVLACAIQCRYKGIAIARVNALDHFGIVQDAAFG